MYLVIQKEKGRLKLNYIITKPMDILFMPYMWLSGKTT